MKTHWLVLALLATLPQVVQAQEGPYDAVVRVGLDQLSFDNGFAIGGPDAASMRRNIDRVVGDGDGILTRAEVDQWVRNSSGTFSENEPNCFETFEFLLLDGQRPLRVAQVSVTVVGLAGSTTSEAPFDYSFSVTFQYPAANEAATATMDLHDDAFYSSGECYLGVTLGITGQDPVLLSEIVLVRPLGPAHIVEETLQPAETRRFWDGEGLRFDSGNDVPGQITFTVQRSSPSGGLGRVQDIGALVGYAAGGTLVLLGIGGLLTEVSRYHLLKFLFLLPGFSRVRKDAVLEHAKREELYNFIRSNQGPSFSDLRRSLDLSNGTLIHHLRILEMQGYVAGQRDGFRKRFYIRGPKIVPTTYLTRTQQQLLDVIGTHPGLTQKELSGLVGMPRELLFYHTKQLAARGRVEIKQEGNRRRYWLSATPATSATASDRRPT